MVRLRLLLALCLIGTGATFGGLALSGYYGPTQNQLNAASVDAKPGAQLVRSRPRQRFVAADTQAASTQAATQETLPWAKPKPPPAKALPREASKPKDKRPQQAAVAWPWNLFSN